MLKLTLKYGIVEVSDEKRLVDRSKLVVIGSSAVLVKGVACIIIVMVVHLRGRCRVQDWGNMGLVG